MVDGVKDGRIKNKISKTKIRSVDASENQTRRIKTKTKIRIIQVARVGWNLFKQSEKNDRGKNRGRRIA